MILYLAQLLAWTLLLGALVFWPAGTFAYPGGWILIGAFTLAGAGSILWLWRTDPGLLRERMASPVQAGQPLWDKIWLSAFMLFFCAWTAFMAWDASRRGFAAMPVWLQVAGLLGFAANIVGVLRTFRENSFAAPVVKVQARQTVIDTGPYALVRHPMYASALPLFVGMPLILGSWLGLVGTVLIVLALAWRAVHEEQALREAFPDYDDYARRVRQRLIPFVW